MISHIFSERTAGRNIMPVTQRHSIVLECDKPLLQSFHVPSSGALMMLTWNFGCDVLLLFHAVGYRNFNNLSNE